MAEEAILKTTLSWSDAIAGYWAVGWPSWLTGLVFASIASEPFDTDTLLRDPWLIAIPMQISFSLAQVIWIRRLVSHNFRYFWIAVVRGDRRNRILTWRESTEVWWRLILAQVGFVVTGNVIIWVTGWTPEESAFRTVNTLSELAVIFVAGPLGVLWAVSDSYGSFQLQAYARERWAPVPAIE